MLEHCLVFHLAGLHSLEAAMGEAATAASLDELERGLGVIAREVLTGVETLPGRAEAPRGLWCHPYRLPPGMSQDRHAAVLTAATQLAGRLAREVFGSATARMAGLRVHQFPGAPDLHHLQTLLKEVPPLVCSATEAQLQGLLQRGGLRTLVQPIVRFADGKLLGYEALSRGPVGSPLERADQLFGAAAHCGLSRELEIACAWQALEQGASLLPAHWLTLNLSSASLTDASLRQALARPGVVVEITEHLPLGDIQALQPLLAELRAGGAQVALDDTGCGYADLEAARALRPDFVKLCITIIRNLGSNPAVLADLAQSTEKLKTLGISILAEGVEHPDEEAILRGLPIDYAQGWRYGQPQPIETVLPRSASRSTEKKA